jgi:hypothetical protein
LRSCCGTDSACAARLRDSGTYGETSVFGLSLEREEIDDGAGGEHISPASTTALCAATPTRLAPAARAA